jgi:alkylation response protein AidB-like acyl-CoA dehydrogenase
MTDTASKREWSAIEFSGECAMLFSSANDFVASHSKMEAVRSLIATESGFDERVCKQMAELGWFGVALPESHEGAGMDAIALTALSEPMGRGLLGSPFLTTTLAGQLLLALGDEAQREAWLPKLATGNAIGTIALLEPDGSWDLSTPRSHAHKNDAGYMLHVRKHQVLDGGRADILLVSALLDGKPALFLVERSDLPSGALTRHTLIDETRRAHALSVDALQVNASALLCAGDTGPALERSSRLGSLLIAAEMTGATHGVMELTLEYLRTRMQFGKLIGSYQALKHPMVDLTNDYERARSLVYAAATAYAIDPDSRRTETLVRMAKAQAGETFTEAVDRCVQFHGAIGFTYECHVQLYFRRAQWSEFAFGDAMHHRLRLQKLLLDG